MLLKSSAQCSDAALAVQTSENRADWPQEKPDLGMKGKRLQKKASCFDTLKETKTE